MPKPNEWYKFVDVAQQFLNASFNRSIGATPFELLIGRSMKLKDDVQFREIIEKELIKSFQQERCQIREEAAMNIAKIR